MVSCCMIYPKIEECLETIGDNKYALTALVAKRAKDLTVRAPGELRGEKKELGFALDEIAKGKIKLCTSQKS